MQHALKVTALSYNTRYVTVFSVIALRCNTTPLLKTHVPRNVHIQANRCNHHCWYRPEVAVVKGEDWDSVEIREDY